MRLASIGLALLLAAAVGLWVYSGDTPLFGEKDAPARQMAAQTPADVAADVAAGPERPARAPVDVLVQDSRAEPLVSRHTLRGVTEAGRRVEVKAETEGLVASERRDKGAKVSKGDLLCRLDLGERPAQLAEAKARLAQAEADANASRQLSSRGFSAETKLAADLAALEAAKASVSRIERDIARTNIVAPFDGLLESDSADLGALLLPGGVCATVVALDPIRFVGYAPERIVGDLAVGQEAEARLITGELFEATVSYVARWADVETRTYRIEAEAPNPDGAVRDGMTASLTIALAEGRAHRLPASALTLDGDGRLGVRLAEERQGGGHVARFAPVEIARDDQDAVWVSGLPEEAVVIVLGQEFVTDGAAITPHRSMDAGSAEGADAGLAEAAKDLSE